MGFSSQSGHVILRTQAVWDTYQADTGTAGVAMKIKGGSLGPNRELLIPDAEIGGGRDVVDAYLGGASWSGDYEFYARMDSLPTLLYAALGEAASALVTGVGTHTITPKDTSPLPYLSIEENVGGTLETFKFKNCVVNTLHLEADANGYLQGTVGIIGGHQEAGVTPTAAPVWDNTPMMVGTNITVTYNAVSLPAKSFSIDINNNFEDDDFRLGSLYIGDLTPKRREISASFGIRESSSALWRQATYGVSTATQVGGLTTKQQLVINAQTYEDIPASTPLTKFSTVFTIPKFILRPYGLDPSGDDIIENDIEGQAVRPDPGVDIMTAVVKNGGDVVA